MRTLLAGIFLLAGLCAFAQERCGSAEYISAQKAAIPLAVMGGQTTEIFLQKSSSLSSVVAQAKAAGDDVITIPVVVHILYSNSSQNLSDDQIKSAIGALNRDFRRKNADTLNTPKHFLHLAADIEIEFALAIADPKGRATSGIIRKSSSIANWLNNDKIKFSAQGGDDAWDSKSYLNIWVGNLISGGGYSSAPGGEASRDGIVVATNAFGTIGRSGNYSMSRVAVHEVGHWLGLKHIWGDAQCGDDGISDTPQQSWYTQGCPSGVRSSCNNGEQGDMYMNYMDYSADACMNLFTQGQKLRMRAAFAAGGWREGLLESKGLNKPWVEGPAIAEGETVVLYPNPATTEINLGVGAEYIGKTIFVYSSSGLLITSVKVTAATQKLNLTTYKAGIYFIKGEGISGKFVKL